MKVTDSMYMSIPHEHQKQTSLLNIVPDFKTYSGIPSKYPHPPIYNYPSQSSKSLNQQDSEIYTFLFESTKESENSNNEPAHKRGSVTQKKSYKKAPQGKMDASDESLLLTLASKYKHDWKKVSKKIFKLNKKKIGPNLLRIRYKELAPDLTQKRVRFTHEEDLKIIKFYTLFGYDWEKIAENFESRTAIMVKNRFYHIKKKNILDKLLVEVESQNSEFDQLNIKGSINTENEMKSNFSDIQSDIIIEPKDDQDSFKFFVEKGESLVCKTVTVPNLDIYFNFEKKDDQLFEKITPMDDFYSEDRFINYGFNDCFKSNFDSFPSW